MGSTVAPEYYDSGITVSGESVVSCSRCGALVMESAAYLHSYWHERSEQ